MRPLARFLIMICFLHSLNLFADHSATLGVPGPTTTTQDHQLLKKRLRQNDESFNNAPQREVLLGTGQAGFTSNAKNSDFTGNVRFSIIKQSWIDGHENDGNSLDLDLDLFIVDKNRNNSGASTFVVGNIGVVKKWSDENGYSAIGLELSGTTIKSLRQVIVDAIKKENYFGASSAEINEGRSDWKSSSLLRGKVSLPASLSMQISKAILGHNIALVGQIADGYYKVEGALFGPLYENNLFYKVRASQEHGENGVVSCQSCGYESLETAVGLEYMTGNSFGRIINDIVLGIESTQSSNKVWYKGNNLKVSDNSVSLSITLKLGTRKALESQRQFNKDEHDKYYNGEDFIK